MYDHKQIEEEMRKKWRKIDLLAQLSEKNKKGESFFMLDGPPYANFIPHVGHIRNTVYKDLFIRLNFMRGKNVLFQPGFDTHGLPVENIVEKKLDIKSKKDIKKIGVDKFCDTCKKHAAEYKDIWIRMYDSLGSWYSWKTPYLTYDNSYLESAWWAFKQMWDKGMVYEGKKPVFWCPSCETALSGYEVTDSYKMVSDPEIFVRFKIKNKDEYLLVFTTTPWTLVSNVAIVALAEGDYVKVKTIKGNLILAKSRLEILARMELGYEILEEFKGKKLDGVQYEPLIDVPVQMRLSNDGKSHKVYMSIPILKERVSAKLLAKKDKESLIASKDVFEDFVSMDEGTGFVHCAPGHGKTDNELGKHYCLAEESPLDDECKYTDDAGKYKGMFVKSADKFIIEDLQNNHKLIFQDKITHKYPLCWRCKSPLIFRMSTQWFLKTEKIRDKMLEENESVLWQPDFAKERFGNWVANAEDWNISRQRFWGIPIPIWKCDCDNIIVIESAEELKKKSAKKLPDKFDLHLASSVEIKCDKCKSHAKRIEDIFDVWFDSGCAPFASLGYPHKHKKEFESNYPVGRINESQDQIRGWFYSLMYCGVSVFDKKPYKAVSMPGWVVDAKGEKMSKSVGNVVWAEDGISELGADVLRFYYLWDIAPYELQKFNKEVAKKEIGRMFNTLWNLSELLQKNAQTIPKLKLDEGEDKWIISKLNSTMEKYEEAIDTFEFHEAGRAMFDFIINDVSRTYIQLVRARMDKEDDMPYAVLNHIILNVVKCLAVISPYIPDKIYDELRKFDKKLQKSVHLEDFPKADKKQIDKVLEKNFSVAYQAISAILAAREKAQIGVRWPIAKITIVTKSDEVTKAAHALAEIIKIQTNIKELEIKGEFKEAKLTVKPDFTKINPSFKEKSPKIIAKLVLESPQSILRGLNEKGKFTIDVDGEKIDTEKQHFIIERILPGEIVFAEFANGEIYLDAAKTPSLEAEGYAREVMRRIQTMRKDAGLQKSDSINLVLIIDKDILAEFSKFKDVIAQKCGAQKIKIESESPQKTFAQSKEEKIKSKNFKICFDVLN